MLGRCRRQLMRWGAAYPRGPGLPSALSLCPASRIGFCGDYLAGPGFGRVQGAWSSAESLAERLVAAAAAG
jgi:predicted NAD/FAD-dependent oxidoreductase